MLRNASLEKLHIISRLALVTVSIEIGEHEMKMTKTCMTLITLKHSFLLLCCTIFVCMFRATVMTKKLVFMLKTHLVSQNTILPHSTGAVGISLLCLTDHAVRYIVFHHVFVFLATPMYYIPFEMVFDICKLNETFVCLSVRPLTKKALLLHY